MRRTQKESVAGGNRVSLQQKQEVLGSVHPDALALLVFALAALVYRLYGFRGTLTRDDAVYLYGGQRMAEGVPPYVGVFDIKGPLSQMLPGAGVILSRKLGADDVKTTRTLFFAFGCFAVVSLYSLGRSLFRSRRVGLFAALTFLGFNHFGRRAASGPNAKTPMVLLQVLSLLWTSERKWFLAGLSGTLSALIWQPTAIFPLITLILAATQARQQRWPASARVLAGIGLPIACTIRYFFARGALRDLLDAAVLFSFRHLDLGNTSITSPLRTFLRSTRTEYTTSIGQIVIGLLMLPYLYVWRGQRYVSLRKALTEDPFASLLLSFPVAVLWSLVHFRGGGDLYWVLPYIALGFAQFVDRLVHVFEPSGDLAFRGHAASVLSTGVTSVLLALAVATAVLGHELGLDQQKDAASEIQRKFGKGVKLLSFGVPEVLVLLHRKNPTRYVIMSSGIDRWIDATVPGGFEGWIRDLEAHRPEVIVFRGTRALHRPRLRRWLSSAFREERMGPWTLYAKS